MGFHDREYGVLMSVDGDVVRNTVNRDVVSIPVQINYYPLHDQIRELNALSGNDTMPEAQRWFLLFMC